MKQLQYYFLLFVLFSFYSCQKEELSDLNFTDFTSEHLSELSGQQKTFFTQGAAESLNPYVLPKLEGRSIDPLVDAALVNLYVQNIDTNYVSYMIHNVGYIAWNYTIRPNNTDNALIIPLISIEDKVATGLILAFPDDVSKESFHFRLLERRYINSGTYSDEENEFAAFVLSLFDQEIFGIIDSDLMSHEELIDIDDEKLGLRNSQIVTICGCIFIQPLDEDKLTLRNPCEGPNWVYRCTEYIVTGAYCHQNNEIRGSGSCELCGGFGGDNSSGGGGTNNTGNTSPTTLISQIINRCHDNNSNTQNEAVGSACIHTEIAEFVGLIPPSIIAQIMQILEHNANSLESAGVYSFLNSIDENDVEEVLAAKQVLQYYLDNESKFNGLQDFLKYADFSIDYGLVIDDVVDTAQPTSSQGQQFVEETLFKFIEQKHTSLLINSDYSTAVPSIQDLVNSYGLDATYAAQTMYDTFMSKVGVAPEDPYQWRLAMEAFREELLPVLLEFTPGIGDLIGAYNDFEQGNYFWGCIGIVSAIVPGDEVIKVIRKADNIRDGWNKVKKIFTLWNKVFSLAGGQKVLAKLPQAWKDLPHNKLATKSDGLVWNLNPSSHHFRLMDEVPGSQIQNKKVPYSRFIKALPGQGTSFMTTTGDWMSPTGVQNEFIHNGTKYLKTNPIFQELTHIPISDITDEMLDLFFL